MTLEVKLTIAATALVMQQNPACIITLTNTGPADVLVTQPIKNPDVPALRITEVATGIEVVHRGHPRMTGPLTAPLKSGSSLSERFQLLDIAHFHAPGEYDISALVQHGKDVRESSPIRLIISPVTPRSLHVVNVQGGLAPIKYGVCVNRAADPPRLIRHQFTVLEDGGATNAWPLVPVPANALPCISACANRSVTHAHWIAWLQGEELRALHVDPEGNPSRPTTVKLAAPGGRVVAPLSIHASDDPATPAPGHALLWIPTGAGPGAGGALQTIALKADAPPSPGAQLTLDGPAPTWLASAERADQSRWVAFARSSSGKSSLHVSPWPDQAGGKPPVRIGDFPGEILAGDAALDEEDTIHIALLVLIDPDHARTTRLLLWSIPKDLPPEKGQEHQVPWPADAVATSSIVRIGPAGMVAVAMGSPGGWALFDPVNGYRAAPAMLNTATTVEVVFLGGIPAFIVGRPMLGIDIIQHNGEPLPHSCG
jgi:hypothetical protein